MALVTPAIHQLIGRRRTDSELSSEGGPDGDTATVKRERTALLFSALKQDEETFNPVVPTGVTDPEHEDPLLLKGPFMLCDYCL